MDADGKDVVDIGMERLRQRAEEEAAAKSNVVEMQPAPVETPAPETQPTKQTHIVCPYCQADPLVVTTNTIVIGPLLLGMTTCAACHKLLPVQILNTQIFGQPQLPPGFDPRGRRPS